MASKKSIARDKFRLLLYDSFQTHRYFEIKKSFAKFFFVFLPTLTIISLFVVSFFIVYFSDIKSSLAKKEPQIIALLKDQSKKKTELIKQLEFNLNELQEKIDSPELPQLAALNLFMPMKGRADRTDSSALGISKTQIQIKGKKLYFSFDLVNATSNNKRLSGHIFVIFRESNTFQIYPTIRFNHKNTMKIPYNQGEFFSTARFRSTEATFNPPAKMGLTSTGHFKILIFSKIGDLLHSETISKNIIQ